MSSDNHRISLIAALSKTTRAIGRDGKLLWSIPEDLTRFKALTNGHPVIMGRKTWESLPAKFRPLPGRTNIVVTRDEGYAAEGGVISHSLEAALTTAKEYPGAEEIFIIGGGQLYTEALPFATRLYLTLVDSNEDGDAYFPEYANEFTKIIEERFVDADLSYKFLTLERA